MDQEIILTDELVSERTCKVLGLKYVNLFLDSNFVTLMLTILKCPDRASMCVLPAFKSKLERIAHVISYVDYGGISPFTHKEKWVKSPRLYKKEFMGLYA